MGFIRKLAAVSLLAGNLSLCLFSGTSFARPNPYQSLFEKVHLQIDRKTVASSIDTSVITGGTERFPVDRSCQISDPRDTRWIAAATAHRQAHSHREDAAQAPIDEAYQSQISANPSGGINDAPDALETRLVRCPILKNAIVWEKPDGERVGYDEWEPEQKARLEEIFFKLLGEEPELGLACVDPAVSHHHSTSTLYMSAEQAFDVYAAHVAHALYLESRHLVPWSLATGSSAGELEQIFASYNYQSIILPSRESAYPSHIQAGRDYQQTLAYDSTWALLCDPRVGYRFLTGRSPAHAYQRDNLVGPSEEQTLINLTTFFRRYGAHGGGESLDQLIHRSLFSDRLKLEDRGLFWATSGCHGAAQLFQDLARSVNIPLLNIGTQTDPDTGGYFGNRTHRGLAYEWETSRARVLWHADEIYAMYHYDPVFPLGADGRPLSPEAARRAVFERYWPRPATLQQWGFAYHPEIVYPEIGFGMSSRGPWEDRADYGWLGGSWRRSDRLDRYFASGGEWDMTSRNYNGDLMGQYELENLYQLCSYELLDYYLASRGSEDAVNDYIDRRFGGGERSGLPIVQFRPLEEYGARARECVEANGGIEEVERLQAAWDHARGS